MIFSQFQVISSIPMHPYCIVSLPANTVVKRLLTDFADFIKSTPRSTRPTAVGHRGGNYVDPAVRKSLIFDEPLDISIQPGNNDGVDLEDIYPKQFRGSYIMMWLSRNPWEVHAYDIGGFFTRHTDGQMNEKHFATVLLFPPSNISPFTGGDLILHLPSGPITISPSTFTQWTVVAFHITVPHECTPVTSGRRYVLKQHLELPKCAMTFDNTELYNPNDVNVSFEADIRYYENKIKALQHKIESYREKIDMINQQKVPSKVQKILDDIRELNENAIIVIPSPTTDPRELDGYDALVFKEVLKTHPYSFLKSTTMRHDKGDGSDSPRNFEPDEGRLYDEYQCEIFVMPSVNGEYGSVKESTSEYNDNTYDHVDILDVTVVCVQKKPWKNLMETLTSPQEDSDSDSTEPSENDEKEE